MRRYPILLNTFSQIPTWGAGFELIAPKIETLPFFPCRHLPLGNQTIRKPFHPLTFCLAGSSLPVSVSNTPELLWAMHHMSYLPITYYAFLSLLYAAKDPPTFPDIL